jgi:hypothetical protein
MFTEAMAWVQDEFHLRHYQEGLRNRLLRTRKQWQQNLAARFRREGYGISLLDGIGLKKLGTKPPKELVDATLNQIRRNKNLACHHLFQTALKHSGMVAIKSDCKYTSRTCTLCGHRAKATTDVLLTCPACGHQEHRDLRGALNPLQAYVHQPVKLTKQESDIVLDYRGKRSNQNERRTRYEACDTQRVDRRLAHDARRNISRLQQATNHEKRTNRRPQKTTSAQLSAVESAQVEAA